MENLAVTAEWKGCLLDEYIVAHWPDISKGRLRDLIRGGAINIEGMSQVAGENILYTLVVHF
jgi:hypothetical protein